jgi:hypothetical protein
LPHSIVADENNILYVADRENGRIEKFDLDGKFLGEIPNLGRTYSLKLGANGTLWAGMQQLNEPPGSPGWVVKLDRQTGKILGYVPVREKAGLHSVEDAGDGQPMTDVGNKVVWFKSHPLSQVKSFPFYLRTMNFNLLDQIFKDRRLECVHSGTIRS